MARLKSDSSFLTSSSSKRIYSKYVLLSEGLKLISSNN